MGGRGRFDASEVGEIRDARNTDEDAASELGLSEHGFVLRTPGVRGALCDGVVTRSVSNVSPADLP